MKVTEEALRKLCKEVIGMQVTDKDGHVVGRIIESSIETPSMVLTAHLDEDVCQLPKGTKIKFNLGLEAVE